VSVEAKGAAQRRRAGAHTASLGVLLCALSCSAGAVQAEFDVFRTERTVPATASGAVLGQTGICQFGGIEQPLSLRETIERTLCNNPKTREAWANVKVQAANVGINKGAYLPTVQGTWQGVRDDSVTDVTGQPQLSSASRSFVRSESLSLNWVLYDFGARSAALENANELFAAARANQDATLQTAFAQAAKDYYAAEAALGAVTTDKEVEDDAKDSFNAATERVNHGVAPITDALQAQTAYAQAVFSRAKAEGDLQTALGTLASDMALSPDTVITLPPVAGTITPDAQFDRSVTDLMDEAKRSHPSVVAAEAQVEAAAAKTRQTRDQGLPSFSFVSKYSLNNQPASLGLGVPTFPATGHDWYFGVQLTIPIFEGFVRNYQVRQAAAQTEVQQYTLDETRNQVGLDVWTAYQALKTATENVGNSATLLDIAQRSEDAAQHRYQAGVGNILELLNAQSSLATAKKQRIQSLTDWRSARLQLAGKLGRLGMERIAGE
jgi:outer membrane protein